LLLLALDEGWFHEPGFTPSLEPVAVAADGDHLTVVSRRSRIAAATTGSPNISPHSFTELFVVIIVATLVAAGDELEEEIGGVLLERQIAELVDNQQLRPGVVAEPLFEPSFGLGLAKSGDEIERRNEQHRVSALYRLAAESYREMGLADARWPLSSKESPLATHRLVASSRTSFGSIEARSLLARIQSPTGG